MINTRRKAATRRPVPGAVRATSDSHPGALSPTATSPATDRQAEYRALMRKWWFGAAIGAPTMILSYPSLIPGLRDFFPRGSEQLWWLWVAMGVASLAVIVYSGNQFFTGAWEALRHRSANMHTLIAIGTGTAWLVPGLLRALPGRLGTVRLRSAGVVLQRRPRPLPRKRVALRLTNVLERANSYSGVGFRGRAPAAGRTRAAAPSVRAQRSPDLRRIMPRRYLALAPAVALAFVACSGAGSTASPTSSAPSPSGPAGAAVQRIEVKLNDSLKMDPAEMTVKAGQPVTFVVTNSGAIDHEFYLGDEGMQAQQEQMMQSGQMAHDTAEGISLKPGESKELTYTFPAVGQFTAGCHVTGHYAAGMKAMITVTP